ncbi:MAG: hypothetical protein V5A46_00815 [Haloferacaceae archaeon]
MAVTRRDVLERLAAESDAGAERTTTVWALAAGFDAGEETVAAHLRELEACALARTFPDGRVRITITGEELLALDVDDVVIVPSREDCSGR